MKNTFFVSTVCLNRQQAIKTRHMCGRHMIGAGYLSHGWRQDDWKETLSNLKGLTRPLEGSQSKKTSAQVALCIILQPVHSINFFLVRRGGSFLSTQEAEARGLSQIQGQPGISSKFQVS